MLNFEQTEAARTEKIGRRDMPRPFSILETQSESQDAVGQLTAGRARLSRIRYRAGSRVEQDLRIQSIVLRNRQSSMDRLHRRDEGRGKRTRDLGQP